MSEIRQRKGTPRACVFGDAPTFESLEPRALLSVTPSIPAPTSVAVAPVSDSQLQVNWTDTSTGESQFLIERAQGSGKFRQIASLAANSTSFSDSGLLPLCSYRYRVKATNDTEGSRWSRVSKGTTNTWLTALPASVGQINLSWTDYAAGEKGFAIDRAGGKARFKRLVTLPADSTTFSDTNLVADTAYRYRIKALGGSPRLRVATATTATPAPQSLATPAPPSGLAAQAVNTGRIDITWTDNSTDEAGFRLELSTDGTNFTPLATVNAGTTTYSAVGLSPSTTYYVRALAYSDLGDSAYSNTANATTQAAPATPGKPIASNTGPTGTLTNSGSVSSSFDGQVIENLNITGSINVRHNNVTIRNCRIDGNGATYPISYSNKTGLVVENCEVVDFDTAAVGPDFTDYTIRGCEIHESTGDALKAEGNVTVESSYIHHLGTASGAHADAVQSSKGSNITIRFNNFDVPINLSGYESNSAIFMTPDFGPVSNVLIEGNWLNGGNYTIYLDGSNITIKDNFFGRGYRYGPEFDTGGVTWTNNRWADTNQLIPG